MKRESRIVDFFLTVGRLKRTPRSGWMVRGIPNPESVAEHVFRTAIIAMVLSDELGLDTERVLRMALLHDLAESMILDLDKVSSSYLGEAKRIAEDRAVEDLLSGLDDRYLELWRELREGRSMEAKLVRLADALEMVIQALEYEEIGFSRRILDEFWQVLDELEVPEEIGGLLDEIRKRRKDLTDG